MSTMTTTDAEALREIAAEAGGKLAKAIATDDPVSAATWADVLTKLLITAANLEA